jgi:type II secretory pathway pseudopilin PulG
MRRVATGEARGGPPGRGPAAPPPGFSLVEAVVVLAVMALTAAVALPILDEARAAAEAAAAARHVAATLASVRLDAARRGRAVALRFDQAPARGFVRVVDGNGDGVRAADVAAGVDVPLGPPDRLEHHFRDAGFRLVWTVPAIDDAGTLSAGDDPVRLGPVDQLTFTPLGTATSGTLYVAGRRGHQFAVRVFGATGRTRVLRYDPGGGTWRSY